MTPQEIESMNYTDFIAFIRETNRCPGGKDTVRKIIQNTFLNRNSKVLEIGSNTGFTSLEIARTVGCQVKGIDISESCVLESQSLLQSDIPSVQNLVCFSVGSAYNIPFKEDSFDLVVTGGATSFMDEKKQAINEYNRVLKPWGFLSATQLFYVSKPPSQVIDNVSTALGVNIQPWTERDWLKIFTDDHPDLELYFYEKNSLFARSNKDLEIYIDHFMNKKHIANLSADAKKAIKNKWKYYLNIFNENHRYLGYFIAIFRNSYLPEEPELFIRRK